MKKRLLLSLTAGFLFVSVLGTLSHFFYEWSGNNFLVGLFSPVSESTWEHMKLLFFPMLLCSFILFPKLRPDFPCAASALCLGILAGTLLIPVLFYTYSGILGYHIAAVDIAIFYICVLFAFYIVFRLAPDCTAEKYHYALYAVIFLFFFCFLLFTSVHPQIALFLPPEQL